MRQHGTAKTEDANSQAGTARREQASSREAVHPVLRLQQSIGNRAVQRMIRAQSSVMEQEDARQEPSAPSLQLTLNDVLASTGHALDDESRAFMESRFGYDFSGVQVHTDSRAAESASAVNAKAYTVGQDIVFGAGQYSPQSTEGRRLIAHELTHVTQQQGTGAQAADLTISEPGDLSEREAEHAAEQVMTGGEGVQTSAAGNAGSPATVQRDDDDDDEGWLSKIGGAISDAGSAVASGVGSAVDAGIGLASDAGSAIASGVGSVVDTGEKLASGAGSAIASGVGSVVNAGENIASDVGSVAGKAWSGAKSVAGDVADFGGEVYGQMKKDAGYVRQGVSAVGSGVDWLEDKAKAGTSWVADKASGIPVLSQVANAGKDFVDFNVDVLGGAAKGVTGLAGGVLSAAADPVDAAKALYTMSEHIPGVGLPQKLLGGAYDLAQGKSLSDVADETLNPMSDAKYWGNVGKEFISPMQKAIAAGKPGEAAGMAGVDALSVLSGAGEVGIAGDMAEVAGAADAANVAEVGDVAEAADAADASQAADVADAGKASSVPPEPVQASVEPNVNPAAPTELPSSPESPLGGVEGASDTGEVESGTNEVWPEEYHVPRDPGMTPVEMPPVSDFERLPNRMDPRLKHLADLADSGDVRPSVATDPESASAYETAQGTMRNATDTYPNLRSRMKTQIEGAGGAPPEGGWHHWRYQNEFPDEAIDPNNIYPTNPAASPGSAIEDVTNARTGNPYTPHTQIHQVTDVPGTPRYQQMADWAKPPQVRDMFNFWNSETPLGDVDELLKQWHQR